MSNQVTYSLYISILIFCTYHNISIDRFNNIVDNIIKRVISFAQDNYRDKGGGGGGCYIYKMQRIQRLKSLLIIDYARQLILNSYLIGRLKNLIYAVYLLISRTMQTTILISCILIV